MNKYEVIVIVKPAEDEATDAVITKVENLIINNGGNIEKTDRWGKRRLAYEVKDFNEGFYCLMIFSAPPKAIAEVDRVLKITDEVLKFMIIRLEQ